MFRRYTVFLTVVITVLFGISAPSHAADDAAALLSKHRAYVGWDLADGTFKTMRIHGTLVDERRARQEELDLRSVGLIFNDAYAYPERSGIATHVGFTGNVFWRSDVNGFVTPVYGDYAKYLAAFSLLLHEATPNLLGTLRGREAIDGKDVEVVRVTPANADAIDLYVDPDTGAYVQAIIDPDGDYEATVHILSYTEIAPGKKLIGSYYLSDRNLTYSFDRVEVNVPIADSELHPPSATASWSYGSQLPTQIELTHDRVLIDGTVNGVKGTFVLATGLNGIYLDDQFADRAGVAVLPNQRTYHDLAHHWATRVRKMKTLQIGDAVLSDSIAFSADFRHDDYHGLDYKGYDGFVGFALFTNTVVDLDISNSTIRIGDPALDRPSPAGIQFLVDLSESTPIVPVKINGNIAAKAMLDTGVAGVELYGPDLSLQRHLKRSCTNMQNLTFGTFVYEASAWCRESRVHENYVRVGYDLLQHFDFVFDYPHGRLTMIQNRN